MKERGSDKRGVSPVIATVLLLVLTLVAVSILSVFVIPFVKNSLSGGEDCVKTLGDISINEETGYLCYVEKPETGTGNEGEIEYRTGFSVRIDNENIVGFKVNLIYEGSSKSFQVESGKNDSNLRMLDKNFGQSFEVPTSGGTRTYVTKGRFSSVEIVPVLENGRICDNRDEIQIPQCLANSPSIEAINRY